jgi:hypothetical protein
MFSKKSLSLQLRTTGGARCILQFFQHTGLLAGGFT